MLSQLFQSLSSQCVNREAAKRRAKRSFRGQFEHLEVRAMLSVSIGSTPDVYSKDSPQAAPDIYIVSVTDGFILPQNDGASISAADETPPLFSEAQSLLAGAPFAAAPKPPEQQASDSDWGGDPRMLPPPVPVKQVIFVGSVAAAEQTTDWEQSKGHETTLEEFASVGSVGFWKMFVYDDPRPQKMVSGRNAENFGGVQNQGPAPLFPDNVIPDGSIRLDGSQRLEDSSRLDNPTTIDLDRGSRGNYGNGPIRSAPLLTSMSAGQAEAYTNASSRAYDAALQSYFSQTVAFTLDLGTSNPQNSNSIAAARSATDEVEGGFVKLEGSDSLTDATTSRATFETIDAVLANLYDLEFPDCDQSGHNAVERDAADVTTVGSIHALGDADLILADTEQGGMVLLQSTAPIDASATAIASTGDAPIDWTVPEGKVQMDVTVGVYQAFDVASGELSSTKTAVPAAIVVPTKQPEQAVKTSVSADQAAKPAKDQASAWVEVFTAAAVAGATKRKRKSRSHA